MHVLTMYNGPTSVDSGIVLKVLYFLHQLVCIITSTSIYMYNNYRNYTIT